jgi:hypothetical protein
MWRLAHASAERVVKQAAEPPLPPLPSCCILEDADEDPMDEETTAELNAKQHAFWSAREMEDCWELPMGRETDVMPWLPRRSAGILEAIERSRRLHSKTPLLVDNSDSHVVDTFFLYRAVQVIEAKQMVVEERTGRRNVAQCLEQARQRLVNAMRYGQTLYVRMSNTACAFTTRYSSPTSLPLAIFDQRAIDELRTRFTGPLGENLFGSAHPLARVLREADTEHGHFSCRPGFEVVLSTHLAKDDFRQLLERALPMELLQPIMPRVSSSSRGPVTPTVDRDGEQSPGDRALADASEKEGMIPWTTVEEAQAAAVRLRIKVEEARARRAGRAAGEPRSSSVTTCNQQGRSTDGASRQTAGDGSFQRSQSHRPLLNAQSDEPPQPCGLPPATRCFASAREIELDRHAWYQEAPTSGMHSDALAALQVRDVDVGSAPDG